MLINIGDVHQFFSIVLSLKIPFLATFMIDPREIYDHIDLGWEREKKKERKKERERVERERERERERKINAPLLSFGDVINST